MSGLSRAISPAALCVIIGCCARAKSNEVSVIQRARVDKTYGFLPENISPNWNSASRNGVCAPKPHDSLQPQPQGD